MNAREAFRARWDKAADDQALSERTREAYWWWLRRFVVASGKRDSDAWVGQDWVAFEHWLIAEKYSYSSRRQARSAVDFVFSDVLKRDLGKLPLPLLPKPERTLVVVPTREELGRLFRAMHGQFRTMAALMYGSGPRVEEACRIRVQDVDAEQGRLRIWDGKGEKNRETVLPMLLVPTLRRHIEWRWRLHQQDLAVGAGRVEMPGRLSRKFRQADREFGWQWLFPSSKRREEMRWYVSPDSVGAAIRSARRQLGIVKRIKCHSLRKAFASHLLQAGMPVILIQKMLGHASLETTQVYLETDFRQAFSPFDLAPERLVHPASIERGSALSFLLTEAA